MLKKIYYLRIGLWLMLAVFIVFVIWQAIVPGGQAVYSFDFKQSSFFVGRLTPRERVSDIKDGRQTLTGQPVYFNLWTPRPFSSLKLTVRYKNNTTPVLEAGLLLDKQAWRYAIKPLHNETIDKLYRSEHWGVLEDGPIILLQRQETYASVVDFLKQLPPAKNVAVYNYALPGGLYKKVDAAFVINPNIQYIIADYQLPRVLGEWRETTVEFDLTKAERTKDGYSLMLSAPWLADGGVDISLIKAEFTGRKLSEFFKTKP
jgi:hypothetical protein